MSTIEITLPPELEAFVKGSIASGAYPDAEHLILQALQLLASSEALMSEAAYDAYTRAAIAEGLSDIAAGRIHSGTMADFVAEEEGKRR